MAEYKTNLQSNVNWLETFKMGRKAPAVANRIFKTLADAQQYVDDVYDSATEGIRVTIIKDPIVENNGLYYVKSVGDGENQGVLVQLGRGTAAWYKGNGVSEDGSSFNVSGATPGDIYMNTNTLDTYVLQDDKTWKLVGNMGMDKVNKTVPYYILSSNGKEHPAFDFNTWVEGNSDGSNIPSNYDDFDEGQIYLWTRFYEEEELKPKYTVSLVYSSLNLGIFIL